jgi:hypothetical protein
LQALPDHRHELVSIERFAKKLVAPAPNTAFLAGGPALPDIKKTGVSAQRCLTARRNCQPFMSGILTSKLEF